MSKKKISVDKGELDEVIRELRDKGMTNRDISEEIGVRIDSYLYNDYNLSRKAFENLLDLYGAEISHKEVFSRENNVTLIPELKINKDLAELFGMILGDGHLQQRSKRTKERNCSTYYLEITLHNNEKKIIKRTEELLREITEIEPKKYDGEGNCIRVVIHSKDAVQKLIDLNLEPGNKKKNQVKVPKWIKEDKDFCRECIKGLIDTDGSIYQDKRENTSYTRVQFSNHSENLLKDFKEMCIRLGFRTVKGGPHQIQVSRSDVSKFIEEIKPIKGQPHLLNN